MKYLIRTKGGKIQRSRAHLWDGIDTVCHMASTGGLNLKKYGLSDDPCGHEICFMCELVSKQNTYFDDYQRALAADPDPTRQFAD